MSTVADGVTQSRTSQSSPPAARRPVPTTPITPVEGPSTLHHLGLTIEQTSMGWAGQWSGPPPNVSASTDAASQSEPAGGPFVLSGADLYRVSCRSCHKPDGTGTENEIHSLIGPVQATSFQWMADSMRARGRSVDAAFIRQLTTANESDLRARLRQGGHNMPAFGQISDQEYRVLRPYLDQLAGVRTTASGPRTIAEPPNRVGELIVKGTCHICHDAVQPNQAPTTVLSGVIPSLASMTQLKTFAGFVHKVDEGAPVPLGVPGVVSRGRMPVFSYLTEAEVAAAYSYLSTYPPR
jgi:mono/diheme cytochrome c family protein